MNICILKESLCIGGTERSAANISKVLADKHKIWIALFDGSQIAYSSKGSIVDFNLPPKRSKIGKTYNTIIRDLKLRNLIRREHIDVLYTFTGISNKQTRYRYKPIKIISARDCGGMQERHSKYKTALDHSDAMICNSEYTKQFYLSKYPEDASKVYTLYNYINIEEIKQQSIEKPEDEYLRFIDNHPISVVSAGRFCKEKGFEFLIEAFGKARENNRKLGLVLVGEGEYKQKYLKIISEFDMADHVYFTGYQKNPFKYMGKCSFFVLSSLSEGFPNVLAEAMALGLPVIADNCYSGPAEIIRKDSDYNSVGDRFIECDYGVLTPGIAKDHKNAVPQLAEAISWLADNPHMMRYYGKKSRLRAEDYSFEMTKCTINAILDELFVRKQK